MSEITDQRTLQVERAYGTVTWSATEFDGGRAYMLTVRSAGVEFHAHFDAEQWASFTLMISEGQS